VSSCECERTNGDTGEGPVSRRRFLQFLAGFSFLATLAGVLTPIIGYLWPPVRGAGATGGRALVGTTTEIPPGRGEVVSVGGAPVLILNQAGEIRGFDAICTHFSCVVEWDETGGYILCPCHDARFNAVTGAVISGPAPAPLPSLSVFVEGGNIYVEV
jgi:nitrite reductase/ring-hydroxylating ferredoxin subunit